MLKKVRVGNIDDDVENLIKARFIRWFWWKLSKRCLETEIAIKKESASLSIKRTQFPLTLAWASTVHKTQGLSLEQGVIDFDLQKQKSFGTGQLYIALIRVKTYDNLYCIGEFIKSAIR